MNSLKRYLFLTSSAIFLFACDNKDLIVDAPSTGFSKYSYKILNVQIDSLTYHHPVALDLNTDGQIDYLLSSALLEDDDKPFLYLLINRHQSLNKILVDNVTELPMNGFWAVPIDYGREIGNATQLPSVWNPDLSKAYFINVTDNGNDQLFGGLWVGKADKYLGLKFKINGKYHYGWLRVSHQPGEQKLTIKDFAYNLEADRSILAGSK